MNNTQNNKPLSRSEVRRRENPGIIQRRRMAFIPLPGQPGARDDPNRAGLSGCAVKWYLRFLKRGVSPDTSRKYALDPNRMAIEETLTYREAKKLRELSEAQTENTDNITDKKSDNKSKNKSENKSDNKSDNNTDNPQDRLSQNKIGLTDSEKELYMSYIALHFEPEEARGKVMHQRIVQGQHLPPNDQTIDVPTEKYKEQSQFRKKQSNKPNDPPQSRVETVNKETRSTERAHSSRGQASQSTDKPVRNEQSEKDLELYCKKHGLTGAERLRFLECMQRSQEVKYAPEKSDVSFSSCIKQRNDDIGTVPRNDEAGFCKAHKIQGSSRKWYMRYRRQGYSMEEAYKKLMERKDLREVLALSREEQRKIFVWKKNPEPSTSKTSSAFSTKNVPPLLSSPDTSNRLTQMVILPHDYPKYTLTENELAAVESAVIDEVSRGWKVNIVFRGIKFGPGMLLIDCENMDTAKWLTYVVPELRGWRGVRLKTCLKENLPNPHTVSIYLPNSAGQDNSAIFAQIVSQNNGLYASEWKLINARESGRDQIIVFSIDHGSWETIEKNGGVLRYGYGMVRVQKKY